MYLPSFSPQPISIVLLLAAAIALVATLRWVPERESPGRGDVKAVIFTAAWWSISAMAENLPIPPSVRLVFGNLAWFGITALPVVLCFLLWTATFGRHRTIFPWVRAIGWLAAVGVSAIAFVNPAHWMYREVIPSPHNDGPLHYVHGPFFAITVLTLYVALIATMVVTLWHQRQHTRRQRRIHLGLIASVLAPILASAAYASGHLLFLSYDPSPFTFLLTAPILMWLLQHGGLCDPLPVARRILLDVLVDAVLVIDADGRLVECNPAAQALPGFPRGASGRAWSDLSPWNAAIAQSLDAPLHTVPFQPPVSSSALPPVYVEITATVLKEDGVFVGHLLLIRDVTAYREAEDRLHAALGSLTQQLQENVLHQETLRAQAQRDPLTNLFNRRALDELLPALLRDAAPTQEPVTAVMLDIDYFKKINDQFGHHFGDRTLQLFGEVLTKMIRKSDLAFRMGGEEFLVLLPGTHTQDAVAIVERWLNTFRMGVEVGGTRLALTLSAGIATVSGPDAPAMTMKLINDADAAVYRAKNGGRDQLSVFTSA